jgi:hypothetical protein
MYDTCPYCAGDPLGPENEGMNALFSARNEMLSAHSVQVGSAASRRPAISSMMNGDHTIIAA